MSFSSTATPSSGPDTIRTGGANATVIDVNTTIDGAIMTSRDLRIEGRMTGTLVCEGVVHIAEGAEVDATVEASGIVVAGTLSGNITCHGRLEIRSTGVVRGRVETGRLIVVEGAVYEGQLRMDGITDVAPEGPPASAESVAPEEPAPPAQPTGSYSFLRNFSTGNIPTRSADDVLPGSADEEEPE